MHDITNVNIDVFYDLSLKIRLLRKLCIYTSLSVRHNNTTIVAALCIIPIYPVSIAKMAINVMYCLFKAIDYSCVVCKCSSRVLASSLAYRYRET